MCNAYVVHASLSCPTLALAPSLSTLLLAALLSMLALSLSLLLSAAQLWSLHPPCCSQLTSVVLQLESVTRERDGMAARIKDLCKRLSAAEASAASVRTTQVGQG